MQSMSASVQGQPGIAYSAKRHCISGCFGWVITLWAIYIPEGRCGLDQIREWVADSSCTMWYGEGSVSMSFVAAHEAGRSAGDCCAGRFALSVGEALIGGGNSSWARFVSRVC